MAGLHYLFLGWGESERPDLVANLLRFGLDAGDSPVWVAADAPLVETTRAVLERMRVEATVVDLEEPLAEPSSLPEEAIVFWIPSGDADPRPFLEAFRPWIEAREDELGRIFTVIDCRRQIEDPSSHGFYELCIHFSDVLLLGNRELVSKKEIQHYRDHLKKSAIPSRIEFLKQGGKVTHAHELLFPEARRLSLYFDPLETETPIEGPIEGVIAEPEEDEPDPREAENDPFLARTPEGNWRKVVHLPHE